MATRCTVKVEGIDFTKLYIHLDGGPESKLPFLEYFNEKFTEKRGDDPQYKIAQLLRATTLLQDKFNLDSSTETGYGLVEYSSDCGEDYQYILKSDGTVTYK